MIKSENTTVTWVVLVSQTLMWWSYEPVTNKPVSMGYHMAVETAYLWACWCCLSTTNKHLCLQKAAEASEVADRWTSYTATEASEAAESRYLPSVESIWFDGEIGKRGKKVGIWIDGRRRVSKSMYLKGVDGALVRGHDVFVIRQLQLRNAIGFYAIDEIVRAHFPTFPVSDLLPHMRMHVRSIFDWFQLDHNYHSLSLCLSSSLLFSHFYFYFLPNFHQIIFLTSNKYAFDSTIRPTLFK